MSQGKKTKFDWLQKREDVQKIGNIDLQFQYFLPAYKYDLGHHFVAFFENDIVSHVQQYFCYYECNC